MKFCKPKIGPATKRLQRKSRAPLGVISDTHGLIRPEALRALAGAELIIHAGDKGKQVLSADSSGPCFYVQLSPGLYTVKAISKRNSVVNLRGEKHFT